MALPYSAAKTIATTAIATMMQVTRQFFIFPNPKRSAQTIVIVICRFVYYQNGAPSCNRTGSHRARPVFELDISSIKRPRL